MDWYGTIKRYYDKGLWTKKMVGDAVYVGKITTDQYFDITGEEYEVPDTVPFSVGNVVDK
ncbi:XkdX family protein [Caldibacillus lycopersici]|uniref:XkdX family protein n=1 Tax=Perspicuibacillus lycopersici TaxID=1325689 RepID=A0AAE3IT15_9BACI|nr:XkdX family protein [Perspicuibacillus lycopersici]MCU9614078.1 XkdX family protein [Perspicuibacillus lycopersici]